MKFAQMDGERPEAPTRRFDLMPVLRVITALYWLGSLAMGYLRLRDNDFSRRAFADVMMVWYAEALVFLAVFGGAALLVGVLGRQARPEKRRKATDPLGNTTMAAIERHRSG